MLSRPILTLICRGSYGVLRLVGLRAVRSGPGLGHSFGAIRCLPTGSWPGWKDQAHARPAPYAAALWKRFAGREFCQSLRHSAVWRSRRQLAWRFRAGRILAAARAHRDEDLRGAGGGAGRAPRVLPGYGLSAGVALHLPPQAAQQYPRSLLPPRMPRSTAQLTARRAVTEGLPDMVLVRTSDHGSCSVRNGGPHQKRFTCTTRRPGCRSSSLR